MSSTPLTQVSDQWLPAIRLPIRLSMRLAAYPSASARQNSDNFPPSFHSPYTLPSLCLAPATSPRLYNLHDLRNVDENKMKAAEQKVKAGGQVTATEIGHAAAVATIKYSVTATAAGSGRRPSDALTTVSRNAGALFDQKQARGEVSGGGDRQAAIYTAATDIAGLLLRYEEADEDIAEIAHRVM